MKRNFLFVTCIVLSLTQAMAQSGNPSANTFKKPKSQFHSQAWWHFIDNHITREGITKDLEAMNTQGVKGVTMFDINRFDGKLGNANVKFNSPEWYDMFKYVLQEAKRLNIEVGAQNCAGWSTAGGPWITPETSMKQYVWRKSFVNGGGKVSLKLDKPIGNSNYYKDAAVVAYRAAKPNSFKLASPMVTLVEKNNGPSLVDGNPISSVAINVNEPVILKFTAEFTADVFQVLLQETHTKKDKRTVIFKIEASANGVDYKEIAEVKDTVINRNFLLPIPKTTAKYFRITIKAILNSAQKNMRLGEIALLKQGEQGLYQPEIYAHLEKTVAVTANALSDFFTVPSSTSPPAIARSADVIDLTGKMAPDGTLNWEAPAGNWTVIRFGYTTTGKKVHPATDEGAGLECDKMDTAALNHHFKSYPQKLIDAAGDMTGKTFTYFLVDSWEALYQNWSANFAAEFNKRRGYSITPYIPVLCGETVESVERSEAFLHDFRQTIADLIDEYYFKHMADLCHRSGMKFHCESIYGGVKYPPLDILKSYRHFDVPMTEFWAPLRVADTPFVYLPQTKITATLPAHAAFLYNKPMVAAEAYTGFAMYSDSPWDIKLYGDNAFTEGVNRLVMHSYVHQPTEKKPGLTLGMYGLTFNRHNTWWPYSAPFFEQQARAQYMLQQGQTVADVLVYLGDKLPQEEAATKTAQLLPGVRFNYINADVLYNRITVKNGKLMLDNKFAFQALVINDEQLHLSTLQKIESLVKLGATLIAPRPIKTLSLLDYEKNNIALKNIAAAMWGSMDGKSIIFNTYGSGKILWGKKLSELLKEQHYIPDVLVKGAKMDMLMTIHKTTADAEIYYLVNKNNKKAVQLEATFRVAGMAPSLWEPVDGKVYQCALYSQNKSTTTVPLMLRAKQGIFVVFNKGTTTHFVKLTDAKGIQLFPALTEAPAAIPTVYKDKVSNKVNLTSDIGGQYYLTTNTGKPLKADLQNAKSITLSQAEGTINFKNEPELKPQPIGQFASFTTSANPLIKYYSGVAAYQFKVDVPAAMMGKDVTTYLQLEEFGSTASISINGKPVATVWEPGSQVDISSEVKLGMNSVEIEVTNPWRNRLIGDMITPRGDKNAWTTSPFKENGASNVINKKSLLLNSGISKPIKIYSVSKAIINVTD